MVELVCSSNVSLVSLLAMVSLRMSSCSKGTSLWYSALEGSALWVTYPRSLQWEGNLEAERNGSLPMGLQRGVRHFSQLLGRNSERIYPRISAPFQNSFVPVACFIPMIVGLAGYPGRITCCHFTFFFSKGYTSWLLHLAPHLQFLLTYIQLKGYADSNLHAVGHQGCLCLKVETT